MATRLIVEDLTVESVDVTPGDAQYMIARDDQIGFCCTGCVSGCGINPTASGCASGGGDIYY